MVLSNHFLAQINALSMFVVSSKAGCSLSECFKNLPNESIDGVLMRIAGSAQVE